MARSRMRHDWNQTADLMALIANVNRPKEKRAYKRSQFHPMETHQRRPGVLLTPDVIRSQRKFFAK
jgi:hypothetical protein